MDKTFAILREVLAAASGGQFTTEAIEREMKIKDLGIDSLKFIMLLLEVEQRIGKKVFSANNVGTVETVQDLFNLMVPEAALLDPTSQGQDAQGHDAQGQDAQGHDAQGQDRLEAAQ